MSQNNISLSSDFMNIKQQLFKKLYDNLNKEQTEAVLSVNGPLLILAGAGTGKTTVLVNRIAHIIKFGNAYESTEIPSSLSPIMISEMNNALNLDKEDIEQILSEFISQPCPPWAILCITFTNKAANEMKTRLSSAVGEEYASQIWAGTFHSICVRLLRKFGSSIGYESNFTIYDSDDSKRVVLSCIKDLNIDEKRLSAKTVLSYISSLKNKLKSPSAFANEVGSDYKLNLISSVYALYQNKLKNANALDFDDIIMQTVRLLNENEEARNYCQNRFKYVCVDEFQDTNYAQLKLVQLFSDKYRNLMVVGDDDQSIYKFRGATIENILNFDREYDDAKIIRLEQNYRSTSNILDAANGVISNNNSRHDKALRTDRGCGDKVVIKKCENQNAESRYIINKIVELAIKEKRKYSDFAVLYRMNAQSQNLEQFFVRSGIPHKVIGGQRFFERKEIKDIIAYLSVINNTSDDLRLKRIINEPKRKIGDKTVSDIEYLANTYNVSMFDIMSEASNYPQICKSASKLNEFVSMINQLRELSERCSLSELFEQTIERSGYKEMLINMGESEADRLDNINELVSSAVDFESSRDENATLREYLEEVALMSDVDNLEDEGNFVTLMTIHSAKGLEFPVVFLPGMEEGIFPSTQSSVYSEEIEEERRLAYVALTRAKDKLFCLNTKERLMFGRTMFNPASRFIGEIPETCVEIEGDEVRQIVTNQRVNKSQQISSEFFSQPALKNTGARSYERFKTGDRVSHAAFGNGTVMSAKKMGTDILYEIIFDECGTKKLMATFAKLKKADE